MIKAFTSIDIEPSKTQRKVAYAFHPVKARRFLTIAVKIEQDEADPTAKALEAVSSQKEKVREAIVKLNLDLPSQAEAQIRYREIQEALKEASYFTIAREIRRETRSRLGERYSEELTPLAALEAYLETQKVPPERRKTLLEYGEKLLGGLKED